MSVSFGKFKRTQFENIQEAISDVREKNLSNTRLRLKNYSGVDEWDNL